jgi:hypothetical protein
MDIVSSRWAFRAHLNVNLLFCSFMNGDSSFQAYGKAYSVVFRSSCSRLWHNKNQLCF